MTRFLKLVRNQNGNWQALPCDSDLAPVTLSRDENAPIDPVQLLNALATLLSPDGGIKSVEEVIRLSRRMVWSVCGEHLDDHDAHLMPLMKKFSKKLVSRCVYCNVLRATKPEILTAFLDENGWNTINVWLQDAKNSNNSPFLYELLQLCKVLPMTVERLKQNNTARLVKSLTKFENADVKELSCELVKKWMTIVKGETNATSDSGSEKKKRKKDKEPVEKEHKEETKIERSLKVVLEKDLKVAVEKSLKDTLKEPAKLKGQKRSSKEKETAEIYEDVKIDPEPLVKKSKTVVDRPKTVKLFNKKFRATGLEEETPLPKPVNKKTASAIKPVAAKTTGVKRMHSSLSERINEKKIKPENLMNNVDNSNHNGGIKLIPAKARPAHILHESASFMDALVAQPCTLPKKKKKVPNKPSTPPTPPSPTITPPKLQFYKDTLEMDENNEESTDKKPSNDTASKEKASSPPRDTKEESAEVSSETDENPATPIDPTTSNMELNIDKEINEEVDKVKNEESRSSSESGPVQLRSILTHGKRPEKKKTVRWVDDSSLKEVFLFDMDETERVNVNHVHHNFGDLKSLEMKREREAFEAARRQLGDRMEETIPWWIDPILIDAPPPLVEPGCNSREREIQLMKQQSTLQEIYFTREMVPDSPHEPELEIFTPQEPKVIPLDDEFHLGTLMDYSGREMPAPKTNLPDVLTSLINIPKRKTSQQQPKLHIPEQPMMENNRIPQPHPSMNMASPYDPGDPMPPVGLLGVAPPSHMFGSPPGPEMENGPLQNEWRPMEPVNMMPPDQYFAAYPGNRPLMIDHMHQSIHTRGGDIRPRMNGPPMVPEIYPPNMGKGPNMPRPTGSSRSRTPRVPCRHFLAGGCRYGASCNFLHPGVNGPLL